jgi:excisionase family DNA binding protein
MDTTTISIVVRPLITALQAIQRDIQEAKRDTALRERPAKQELPVSEVAAQPKKLFGFAEAVEFLCGSKRTLYRLVSKKQVPHYRIGKRYLFNEQLLLTWLEGSANRTEAASSQRRRRS